MPDNLLTVESIRKEFGGLLAVSDLDFTIPAESIVSLIGPNGAGKTTFFNMLTGVYKPTSGQIVFDGTDVTGKPPHAITKLGIGRTFQNIRLFPQMTALENVLVGMHSRLKGGILGSIFGTPRVRSARSARPTRRAGASALLGPRPGRRRARRESLLWRSAPAGARPGACDRTEAASARRADGRHEPAGDGGLHRFSGAAPHGAADHDPPDRARHEGRDGHLRAGHGARLRAEDRRRHAGRGPDRTSASSRPISARRRLRERRRPTATAPCSRSKTSIRTTASIEALQGISLEVHEGEIVTLIGANGAGKSTTLRVDHRAASIARQGSITFDGQDITREPPHEIVAPGISQSPEGRSVFARMSVLENLEMGAFQRRDRGVARRPRARLRALPAALSERKQQRAGTLSGGEQQMLAIGRALMARPGLLLLDEPSMGLAPILVERDLRDDRRDQPAGHDDPAGRAERHDGA